MEFRVLTLRYSPTLAAIDESPLLALGRSHEILALREHFFVVHDMPHLLCVVICRPTGPREASASTEAAQATTDPPLESEAQSTTDPTAGLTTDQRRLFDAIRRWRFQTALHAGVPPYVVLTNRNVAALVHARPDSLTALGKVRGIGKAKVERYGKALLALLRGESPASTATPVAKPETSASTESKDPAKPEPSPVPDP